MITKKYNREIRNRIAQQQNVLDKAEIDLAVAKKLDAQDSIERHQKRIANIQGRIDDLEAMVEPETVIDEGTIETDEIKEAEE